MNLFVDKDEEINFSVFIGLSKDSSIVAKQTKQEVLKTINLMSKQDQIKEFTFCFKRPNYRADVDLMSSTVRGSGDGQVVLDLAMVRYLRVIQLAKSWNLTGKDGQILPFTSTNIDRLAPVVASLICSLLQKNINKLQS